MRGRGHVHDPVELDDLGNSARPGGTCIPCDPAGAGFTNRAVDPTGASARRLEAPGAERLRATGKVAESVTG